MWQGVGSVSSFYTLALSDAPGVVTRKVANTGLLRRLAQVFRWKSAVNECQWNVNCFCSQLLQPEWTGPLPALFPCAIRFPQQVLCQGRGSCLRIHTRECCECFLTWQWNHFSKFLEYTMCNRLQLLCFFLTGKRQYILW